MKEKIEIAIPKIIGRIDAILEDEAKALPSDRKQMTDDEFYVFQIIQAYRDLKKEFVDEWADMN